MIARTVSAGLLVFFVSASTGVVVGQTRLVSAVKEGNAASVRELMDSGVDVNAPEADGTTALHWAVRMDDVETAQALIRHGANVHAANRYGATSLWLAATSGNAALVDALLAAGADANTSMPEGETVLMAAARTASAVSVRRLLAHGADPNAREGWYEQTALMWAAAENRSDVARALIEHGADINSRSAVLGNVATPLRDMTLSTFAWGGFTPLLFAAREGSVDAARVLIEAGADVNVTEPEFGNTPLLLAIMNGHFDVAALLVEGGVDLTRADKSGKGALYSTVDMHSPEHVINRPPTKPSGTLDSVDLVRLLLEHGADPNATLSRRARSGVSTPLTRAAKTADVAMMRLLLENGADPHLRVTGDYSTVLMVAAGLGWSYGSASYGGKPVSEVDAIEAIRLCLERGIDINASNADGTTALHAAASKGADSVVQFLVSNGAWLNTQDKRGRTALDVALAASERSGLVQASNESTVALLRRLMRESEIAASSLAAPLR